MLYAVATAIDESDKTRAALQILTAQDLVLSVQVLQEFYVQATHQRRPDPLTHQQACALIQSFRRFPVVELTLDLLDTALHCRDRFSCPIGMQPSLKPPELSVAAPYSLRT
ncbi:MAG: hypothetical protein KF760_01285 [Candidatus Eremiobacteraeota bacterium]|nr:hypothetical protein [Candidatus Eremiobacteraeota bacterium]MCW5872639.1 hypothetical protein [Candidatus Eremiobacteraeota bacterium]